MSKLKISRKKFLFSSLASSGMLFIPDLNKCLSALSSDEITIAKKYPLDFAKKNSLSPIETILFVGITAPNSHNTQPWKFRILSESSFELYIDIERQLLPIDPLNRQLYHTQGTFLEFAKLAANELGYTVKIQYFPQGSHNREKNPSSPVAKFSFNPKKEYPIGKSTHKTHPESIAGHLLSALPFRQMNRGKYVGDYLTENSLQGVNELASPGRCKLVYAMGESKIQELVPIFNEAFAVEIADPVKNNVSRDWFRISKEEIYSKRDGITLEGNGLTQPVLWMAKTFFMDMIVEGWNSKSSIKQSNDAFSQGMNTSRGLVFFVTYGEDDELDWIRVGMDFARYTLAVAKEGFAFHTANQAFVDYKESLEFQKAFKQKLGLPKGATIQLAGRLGRADLSFQSPRRGLDEFLIG